MACSPQLILTVDYETFGDGSGCVEHCIVNPASRLLEIADYHGAPLTFFVEVLELQAMERVPFFQVEVNKVKNQLKKAVSGGHDLQLHIHPQWENATWSGNEGWELALNDWRIGDLSFDKCLRLLNKGKLWLEELVSEERTPYQCIAFRAGGWCIQPSKDVVRALLKLDFRIDSTVAPSFRNIAKGEWSDFRNWPKKPWWRTSNDVCTDEGFGLYEVPISTGSINPLNHIKTLWSLRSADGGGLAPMCQGTYQGPDGKFQAYRGKIGKLLRLGRVMLDFSTMPSKILIAITKQWIKRYSTSDAALPIVAIGHTKNFTFRSELALSEYLTWAKKEGIVFSTYGKWLASL